MPDDEREVELRNTLQEQGCAKPLTYAGEVPVKDWVVDFHGDMGKPSPIRYIRHEEFLRKKAEEQLDAEETRPHWWHRAARRLRSRNRKTRGAEIKDAMTERELRDAGVAIDLPTEAASPNPQPLRYSDGTSILDDDMPWNQNGRGGRPPGLHEGR